ncbi:putative 2-aminoethylphosphonate ABC transporter permease subunit [Stappia stellulata]|uniref:putative 2-aminoethylphosphonate ABC transporter permease subunit n=1 Tax=Stappia TaxID=152161 RepID=UPI001CD7C1DA|nr:putative 2-aminoethylphosphonate ABC transporter permease subunit [Stappia stellulata]MCA1240820.1 putative 2-aminoethylphosphonate ABC transporter permease subunit [Stappia stellulata]
MSTQGLEATASPAFPSVDRGRLVSTLGVLVGVALLLVFVAAPLITIFLKSLQNDSGTFVGLDNFVRYFSSAGLIQSLYNSVQIALTVTVIACGLAFCYAYALTRTCMPFRGLFRAIAMIPILAPSLLSAIALIYLFGNQGMIRELLFGNSVYGPIGIVLGITFYVFPHVLMIMVTALSSADARLYEAAEAMGTSRWRVFWTITVPGARYGLISAGFVVFTLTITDFGVPKVIGGNFNVLATDIYKQVVGQQSFSMGAVVGLILLFPAILSFSVDRIVRKRQVAQMSARAVPYVPQPSKGRDRAFFVFCSLVSVFLIGILGTAVFASLVTYWPYNLSLTLAHYDFNAVDPNGWSSFTNSLEMAAWTALIGTCVIFLGAYFVEKADTLPFARGLLHMLAMIPMAVPGLVLGLAYVFFFSTPTNPLSGIYGTMAILVLSTVVHFYTVAHLSFVTALKQLDKEFEAVSASLKVPAYKTMLRVHVPICLPLILNVAIYLFLNAMTTVSAAVFLYAPDTKLASIAVLNMDDVGDQAPASAMAIMIVLTSVSVKLLQVVVTRSLLARSSAWRNRDTA